MICPKCNSGWQVLYYPGYKAWCKKCECSWEVSNVDTASYHKEVPADPNFKMGWVRDYKPCPTCGK